MSEEQRYRTEEEQTEGQMPENVWLIGYAATVRRRHCSREAALPCARRHSCVGCLAGFREEGHH